MRLWPRVEHRPGPSGSSPLLQLQAAQQRQRLVSLHNREPHVAEAILAQLEVRAEELLAPDQESLPHVEWRILQQHCLAAPILSDDRWFACEIKAPATA